MPTQTIIGLGNPGERYLKTRHNAGYLAVEEMARRLGLDWNEHKKTQMMIAQGDNLLLAKPQLFMNESGLAAAKLLSYFKLALPGAANPDTLIVFHDDLDIELGNYRLKAGSGSAGHKGVESIFAHLGTKDFTRLRIGIKTPELKHIPSEKFVLQRFPQDELAALNGAIQESLDQLLC